MRLGSYPIYPILVFELVILLSTSHSFSSKIQEILVVNYKFKISSFKELNYLSNLGGKNILKLFNQDLAERFLYASPINTVNQHHLIWMTLATSDYLNNTKLCIQSAIMHGLLKSELVIISLDFDVYQYFLNQGIQTMFLNYSLVLERNWFNVGRLKQAIQYYFNCFDADVLFFESDMIFCSNFKNELIETLNDNVDIQIMEESHVPRRRVNLDPAYYGYNIGLMLVKSSNNTRNLFRRWLHDCYFTRDNLWDQNMFNFIVTNNGRVFNRNITKQYLFYMFNLDGYEFPLTFHFLNPVKYINYCSLIQGSANHFNSSKINELLSYAKEMNLIKPNLLHFACINGPNKFTYMKNISLNEDSYEYHMNYLKKFHFVN